MNSRRDTANERTRVAAYCRVSTDGTDQSNSFESQQKYFRDYIERNPEWELYEIFADEGSSGTSTKKRAAFNRMIACAENGCFDMIITKEISRFARNTLDSIFYTRELKRRGVGVIFLNDNINTLDSDAELRLAIMSSIAQEESRRTSERVKWGQKRRMEQGVVFGRSMLGYDVCNGKMYVNERGAAVVRMIFEKFLLGKGTHAIARELTDDGVPPMRVEKWHNTSILRILRNEKYCGDLVQKKSYTPDFLTHEKRYNHGQEEFIILRNHHEAIVPREIFEEANRILDEKALSQGDKAKFSNRYPLSGKLTCGLCGSVCAARYRTRKSGNVYRSWRCLRAVQSGAATCAGRSFRGDDAVHILRQICANTDLSRLREDVMQIIRKVILCNINTASISEKTQKKRLMLIELYANGDIDKEEFLTLRAKCDAELARLGAPHTDEEVQTRFSRTAEGLDALIKDTSRDGELFAELLERMTVTSPESVDVKLKCICRTFRFEATDGYCTETD